MDTWAPLADLTLLLGAAALLGILASRLGQSAIIGYLAAGMLLGPNALHLVQSRELVSVLAELGVALLLFTIGLELNAAELRTVGRTGLSAGALQVGLTGAAGTAVALALGLPGRGAVAVGAIVALSSTAVVLGALRQRAEVDSVHGRLAIGILLFQDVAIVPLVVLVTALGQGGGALDAARAIGIAAVAGLLLCLVLWLGSRGLPRLFTAALGDPDLPILVTVTLCIGTVWAAHAVGLSPSLGAFIAGVLLAGTPLATRVRADVSALRALCVTVFFASVGMLAELGWAAQNWGSVALATLGIVVGKPVVAWIVGVALGHAHRPSLAGGACVGQVGELSFVLAGTAHSLGLLGSDSFRLVVSATVASLFVTPYLVAGAPRLADGVVGLLARLRLVRAPLHAPFRAREPLSGHVIVVGLGPAGRGVVAALRGTGVRVVFVDMNPAALQRARHEGIDGQVGDATSDEVLVHLGVESARALIVTVPDFRASLQVIQAARARAPSVPIVVRGRYHVQLLPLVAAGADIVVDEEAEMGERLGREVRALVAGESPGG
jgi:CPA2 family monovalent cation:H+ antiporter-2